MKKIEYNELGKYFKEEFEKHLKTWGVDDIDFISEDTADYIEHVCPETEVYDDENGINKCHIELTYTNVAPLVIEFYQQDIFDENDNYDGTNYYID